MKILVIGKGGREHTLAWSINRRGNRKIYYVEANAGMEDLGEKLCDKKESWQEIAEVAKREGIDFTVVGPEKPLVEGIGDIFREKGLRIFAPGKRGANLEGSKVFAKELMRKYSIPTADFEVFNSPEDAIRFLEKKSPPYVVKADGLAGGKGAIVCKTREEGRQAVEKIMIRREFGEAGDKIVVEEFLEGEEASILGITDGNLILPLLPSQDHKPVYDGDRGPNTGGMGAYAPYPGVDRTTLSFIEENILKRTLEALNKERIDFRGVLYAGLMLTSEGPRVLEFNVRFGDPETQAILPLLQTDLLEIMFACEEGSLEKLSPLGWEEGYCVCVVIASRGYPGKYEKGKVIRGIEAAEEECLIFHAGTKRTGERILTDGGRVLGVCGIDKTLNSAIEKAYRGVEKIEFEGKYFRRDIGKKGLKFLA